MAPTPTDPPVLPLADATDLWQALPAAALRAWRLGSVLGALVPLLLLAGPLFALTVLRGELGAPTYLLAVLLLYLLLAGFGWWYAGLHWRHTCWRLDGHGLRIRQGAWWRRETLVPQSRVQHVDLGHGPLDRRFGLAGLKVHTAGTRLSSVQLSGLAHADAERLRDALVADRPATGGQDARPTDAGAADGAMDAGGGERGDHADGAASDVR